MADDVAVAGNRGSDAVTSERSSQVISLFILTALGIVPAHDVPITANVATASCTNCEYMREGTIRTERGPHPERVHRRKRSTTGMSMTVLSSCALHAMTWLKLATSAISTWPRSRWWRRCWPAVLQTTSPRREEAVGRLTASLASGYGCCAASWMRLRALIARSRGDDATNEALKRQYRRSGHRVGFRGPHGAGRKYDHSAGAELSAEDMRLGFRGFVGSLSPGEGFRSWVRGRAAPASSAAPALTGPGPGSGASRHAEHQRLLRRVQVHPTMSRIPGADTSSISPPRQRRRCSLVLPSFVLSRWVSWHALICLRRFH